MLSIGLDVGTTGAKAAVCGRNGTVHGLGFVEYDVLCPAPGLAEQRPAEVWASALMALEQAVAACPRRGDIGALSVSVQGDAVIPVDRALAPLHNALLGMDYRSRPQSDWFGERFGERALFERTGMRPHPLNSATKILWLMEERPGVAEATWKYMTYADYILAMLGADEAVIDHTMASRTMLFLPGEKRWSADILGAMGLDEAKLSRPVASGTPVGTLARPLAQRLGLPAGVALVAGGHDQCCAALGAGVVQEDIAVDSHGTAEVISTAFGARQTGEVMFESYYPCYCHARDGMYFTFSLNHVGGLLLKWYRDNFCAAEVAAAAGGNAYRLMEDAAPEGPSPVLVLPHFNGSGTPWCDLASKGAFVGMDLTTTRHDITKGIMDSLAYELRINLERLRQAGIPISQLRAVGGGANSPRWLQIKADVTGCAVSTLKVREAACLGAALLGFAGAGECTLDEAVAGAVHPDKTYEPGAAMAPRYEEKYRVYRQLYGSLRDINRQL